MCDVMGFDFFHFVLEKKKNGTSLLFLGFRHDSILKNETSFMRYTLITKGWIDVASMSAHMFRNRLAMGSAREARQ